MSIARRPFLTGLGVAAAATEFLAVAGIGGLFFWLAILRFRPVAAQAM